MSKNVLFVGSHNRINELLDTEAQMYLKKVFSAPSLGLHRMAEFLRPEHEVAVYDPNTEKDPSVILRAVAPMYDIIGFSLTHATLEYDIGLMWAVRASNKDCIIVAGGEEATFNASLLEEHSPVDIIVLGEGEKAMAAICGDEVSQPRMRMPLGEDFRTVTLDIDFASIPYEAYWEQLEKRNKNFEETRTVRLFTSNYCPYGCLFCSATHFLNFAYKQRQPFVSMPAEGLLVLVQKVLEAHPTVRTIFFQDDNFIIGEKGRERVFALCKGIMKGRAKGTIPDSLKFMCETRVDTIDEPMLKCMAEAGFRLIFFGAENFSQKMLDEFKKGVSVEQIERVLEWTYQTGMTPYITIILTSPNCVVDDIIVTVAKCKEHSAKGALLGVNLYIIPLPGCEVAISARDCIEYRRVWVPGTDISFNKAERIIPKDKRVRKVLEQTNKYLKELSLEEMGRFISHDKSVLDLEAVTSALEV